MYLKEAAHGQGNTALSTTVLATPRLNGLHLADLQFFPWEALLCATGLPCNESMLLFRSRILEELIHKAHYPFQYFTNFRYTCTEFMFSSPTVYPLRLHRSKVLV